MRLILITRIILQVTALLETLEFQESAKRKGHFALYNCLVLGHTKYNGVQGVYRNPFPAKPFYGSRCLDMVVIRPPGINNGCFVVSPDTVWCARVCSYSQHLLWLTLDPRPSNVHSYQRWKLTTTLRMVIISIKYIIAIITIILINVLQAGLNLSVPGYYTSSTTRNQFSTSSLLKVSWENCQQFLSVTP